MKSCLNESIENGGSQGLEWIIKEENETMMNSSEEGGQLPKAKRPRFTKREASSSPSPKEKALAEAVIDDIKEAIACRACFSLDMNMRECSNGHLVCLSCFVSLRRLQDDPRCPSCREPLTHEARRPLVVQQVVNELPHKCLACSQTMRRREAIQHLASQCPRRLVSCKLAKFGCTWLGEAHERNSEHAKRCAVRDRLHRQSFDATMDEFSALLETDEQSEKASLGRMISVFGMMEEHEPKIIDCLVLMHEMESNCVRFVSDEFQANQSRWVLEVTFNRGDPPTRANTTNNSHDRDDEELDSNQSANLTLSVNTSGQDSLEESVVADEGISFRVRKTSKPGAGRNCYAFSLFTLELTHSQSKWYTRPKLTFNRFETRNAYSEHQQLDFIASHQRPLTYESIRNESLVQVKLLIARRLCEEVI